MIGLFSVFNSNVSAQNMTNADNINVILVLDTSYSMNETDKDKVSIEMLKLFADISYAARTRIGFVAYNDQIEAFTPLTEVITDRGKEDFKRGFDSLRRVGRTDTGLGLKKAWELLSNADTGRKSFIILLTDGEIDIDSSKNKRTVKDSLNDIKEVVDQAAAKQVPIYTVAMKRNGVDLALLKEIASKTSASSYIADVPQDLLEVFGNIFAAGFTSRIVPMSTVMATGEYQEINIKIPNDHASEANLIFLSSSAMKEVQVFDGSQSIGFSNSHYYSSIKVINPDQQEVKVRFKGNPNDVIKVSMLLHHDLKGDLEVKGKGISGKPIKLIAYLIDSNTGRPICDKDFYSKFTATAIIKNLDTGKEVAIPAQATENGWEIHQSITGKGRYSLGIQTDNYFYNKTAKTIEFKVIDDVWLDKMGIVILVLTIVAIICYRERLAKTIRQQEINKMQKRKDY